MDGGRRLVAAIALTCFLTGFGGCSWTATIARTDELDNEAVIDHSDADALYLRARNGQLHRIERRSVRSIDHPGNVEMLVGAILMGFTGLLAYENRDEPGEQIAPLVLVWGGTAGALILSGLIRYVPSLRAAWDFQFADEPSKQTAPPTWPGRTPPPAPGRAAPPEAAPPPAPADDEEEPEVIPGAT